MPHQFKHSQQAEQPYDAEISRIKKADQGRQPVAEGGGRLIDLAMTGTARFPLGQLAITANASLRLSTEEVLTALRRHARGDWGDLCPEDALANDEALRQGGRLLSAYGQGESRFWIITEWDRSVTTVLLPLDY